MLQTTKLNNISWFKKLKSATQEMFKWTKKKKCRLLFWRALLDYLSSWKLEDCGRRIRESFKHRYAQCLKIMSNAAVFAPKHSFVTGWCERNYGGFIEGAIIDDKKASLYLELRTLSKQNSACVSFAIIYSSIFLVGFSSLLFKTVKE